MLGTLLGSGFLCNPKRPYLCIQHKQQDREYLLRKAASLNDLGRKTSIYEKNNTIGWRASCDDCWGELYDLCYRKKKTISMKWLDQLHGIGLAIWFCDSGTFTGYRKQNAMLRTAGFHDDNEIIERYFQEVGIQCNSNVARKSYNMVFSVEGTSKLMDIISPYVPDCASAKWKP